MSISEDEELVSSPEADSSLSRKRSRAIR